MVFPSGAHLKRIAIRQVRRNIAGIGDRDIWTLLSQAYVVTVVSKQHRIPPKKVRLGYSPNCAAVLGTGEPLGKCASFLGAVVETSEISARFGFTRTFVRF